MSFLTFSYLAQDQKQLRANVMINITKIVVKKIFNKFGLDVVKFKKLPVYSLLGLKNLPIRTIIDVGANEGQFVRMIQRFFPEAMISCFEPIPDAFVQLDGWAKTKNGKVKTFNLALGDYESEIEILYHTEHSPSSSILKTTEVCENFYPFKKNQQTIKVKMTTLDKAIDDLNISLVPEILIKLDVQGYEDRVIMGGKLTFAKAKACILEINLDELYKGQPSFKDISLLLYEYGYRYAGNLNQSFAKDGHIISIDAVFMRK